MTKAKCEEREVAWFIAKKGLIKFEGDDTYSLSEKVIEVSDFDKYPILKGDIVEATIVDEEVVFLRKIKTNKGGSPKKTSVEEPEEKTLTIDAIFENISVKFKEEKINGKKWTEVSDELKEVDFMKLGLKANNVVTVVIENGVIVEVKESEEDKNSSTKYNNYSEKNSSIEKQCALKSAVEVVKILLEQKEIEKDKTEEVILALTKICYRAIQEA